MVEDFPILLRVDDHDFGGALNADIEADFLVGVLERRHLDVEVLNLLLDHRRRVLDVRIDQQELNALGPVFLGGFFDCGGHLLDDRAADALPDQHHRLGVLHRKKLMRLAVLVDEREVLDLLGRLDPADVIAGRRHRHLGHVMRRRSDGCCRGACCCRCPGRRRRHLGCRRRGRRCDHVRCRFRAAGGRKRKAEGGASQEFKVHGGSSPGSGPGRSSFPAARLGPKAD